MLATARFGIDWSPWLRYPAGVALFGIALLVRLLMLPIDGGVPYLMLAPAALLALLLFGTGPGMLAALLGAVAGFYIFTPPFWTWRHAPVYDIAPAVYFATCALVAWTVGTMRRYADRLRHTGELLRLSEQRLLRVLEDQTESIARSSADGTLLFVNDSFCRLVGRSREALIGHPWKPLAVDEDVGDVERQLAGLTPANPVVTVENRIRSADGAVRWAQFVNRGFFDAAGRLQEIQSVGRDITERKRTEQERVERQREQQVLIDSDMFGIGKIRDRRILWNNRGLERIFGYGRGELQGRSIRVLYPDDEAYERLGEWARPLVAVGAPIRTQIEMIRADGSPAWIDAFAEATDDAGGYMFLFADLSGIRRQHEQVRQLALRLDTVREDERRSIARTLHEGIAQDLFGARLALHPLLAQSSRLPALREIHDRLSAMLDAMMKSLRDLTNAIRPTGLDQMPLVDVLRWYVQQFARDTGLDIDVAEVAPPPPLDERARLTLFRALQELLTNVAKHAGAHRVRITIGTGDDRVQLTVGDDGKGMSTADERKAGSLGILALRERLAESGGTLTIVSTAGAGTTVTVALPLPAPGASPPESS